MIFRAIARNVYELLFLRQLIYFSVIITLTIETASSRILVRAREQDLVKRDLKEKCNLRLHESCISSFQYLGIATSIFNISYPLKRPLFINMWFISEWYIFFGSKWAKKKNIAPKFQCYPSCNMHCWKGDKSTPIFFLVTFKFHHINNIILD